MDINEGKLAMEIAESKSKAELDDIKRKFLPTETKSVLKKESQESDEDSEYFMALDSPILSEEAFDSIVGSVLERSKFIPLRLSYEGQLLFFINFLIYKMFILL